VTVLPAFANPLLASFEASKISMGIHMLSIHVMNFYLVILLSAAFKGLALIIMRLSAPLTLEMASITIPAYMLACQMAWLMCLVADEILYTQKQDTGPMVSSFS
jgi:hypothetical protein